MPSPTLTTYPVGTPLGIVMDMQTGATGAGFVDLLVGAFLADFETGPVVLVTDLVTAASDHLLARCAVFLFVGLVYRDDIEIAVDNHERTFVRVDQRSAPTTKLKIPSGYIPVIAIAQKAI